MLGLDAESIRREGERRSSRMRIFIAVRARFAEDAIRDAVEQGLRQLVVLGAGLDTFAYRNPFGERLRVFEVDHPATQAWKRERLRDADIALPECLVFVPVDLERESLAESLAAAGFDRSLPSFFSWSGVVPYLGEDAIRSTLDYIARVHGGAQVVFDYIDPPEALSPEARAMHDRLRARVEAVGEPFLTYFEPAALHAQLRALGFTEIEDSGPAEIAARWFPGRTVEGRGGGHIVLARVSPAPRKGPPAE